jgi:aspartate aminotransferase
MAKIQSQSTSNPSSISQAAAQAALEGDQDCVARMVAVFKERHDYVLERLNRLNGVSCLPAQGAFYAFPNMQRAIESLDGVSNDIDFAEHLISEAGVALVPGSAFGAPGYARLSYATSMDNLRRALDRLENVLGTKN